MHSHCSCSLLALQTLQEEKERKSECLPPEPHPDDPESVKIIFKLPNDSRVERRFHFTQSLTVSLGQSSGALQSKGVKRLAGGSAKLYFPWTLPNGDLCWEPWQAELLLGKESAVGPGSTTLEEERKQKKLFYLLKSWKVSLPMTEQGGTR